MPASKPNPCCRHCGHLRGHARGCPKAPPPRDRERLAAYVADWFRRLSPWDSRLRSRRELCVLLDLGPDELAAALPRAAALLRSSPAPTLREARPCC